MRAHDPSRAAPCSFGERLKEARTASGISQNQLARLTGCTSGLISQIESGLISDLKSNLMFHIAEAVNVAPAWLALGVGDPHQARITDEEERALLTTYRQLSEENRRIAERILRTIQPRK